MRPALGVKCSMNNCDNYASTYIWIGHDGQDPEEIPVCDRCRREMATILSMEP